MSISSTSTRSTSVSTSFTLQQHGFIGLYYELKDHKELARLYPLFFVIRKLFTGLTFGFIKIYPFESCLILFGFVQLSHIVYLIIIKPFHHAKENLFDLLCEMFLLFYTIFLITVSSPSMWGTSLSMTIVSFIFVDGLLVSLGILGDSIRAIITSIRNRVKASKNKVVNDQDDIKPIENILNHITRLTSLALEERRMEKYEESKIEVTLEDINSFKKRGRTFRY